jgi:hypothetical protein
MNLTTFNREDGKTVVMVDASLFKKSKCLLEMFYMGVLGIRGRLNNNDMEIGSAFHKFRATFRREGKESYGRALNEALHYWQNTPMIVKSKKKYLTDAYLIKMCLTYAAKYGNGDELEVVRTAQQFGNLPAGTSMIEPVTRFMFPYYVDDYCEISVGGTIDELAKIKSGIHVIVDAKTTACWDHEDYFRGYDLNPQLLTYRWAWEQYAKAFPDSLFASVYAGDIGAQIDGIFLAGADKDIVCKRSTVFTFNQDDVDEFGMLVESKVSELANEIKKWRLTGKVPLRYGMLNNACENQFGRCEYFKSCAAKNQVTRMMLLERDFKQEQYNPLNHGA